MSKHLLHQADIDNLDEVTTVHQFNDNAIRLSRNLSGPTAMSRIGIHIVRIESGHDSTTHHYHEADEEFVYVLSGRGKARIGEEEFDIEAGDFMGFSAPSPAHSMHNPYAQDLVYLMGGERWATDVVHYPDIKRSLIKTNGRRTWTDWQDLYELPPR